MQTSQQISLEQLNEIVTAVFAQGPVAVRQAYSDLSCATRESCKKRNPCSTNCITNRESGTFFDSTRSTIPRPRATLTNGDDPLKPEACNGHTFRFCQEGWGLIQLQCDFRKHPIVDCRIAVNSAIRAGNWSDTYPRLSKSGFMGLGSCRKESWAVSPAAAGGWARPAEPTDEADRGRHPGFARHEGLAGGPGSLSLSFGEESMEILELPAGGLSTTAAPLRTHTVSAACRWARRLRLRHLPQFG